MSKSITVVKFWYVITFSIPEFLLLVPIFPASCAGTLVLGFYMKIFSFSPDVLGLNCLYIWSYFTKRLSQILSIVKGLSSLSNIFSIICRMVWYFSGKFNNMWVIVYELWICTSVFGRSPPRNSNSMIHSPGFLGVLSSFHLSNIFHSLVQEHPVVSSKFPENLIHACLSSLSLCIFFISLTI